MREIHQLIQIGSGRKDVAVIALDRDGLLWWGKVNAEGENARIEWSELNNPPDMQGDENVDRWDVLEARIRADREEERKRADRLASLPGVRQ